MITGIAAIIAALVADSARGRLPRPPTEIQALAMALWERFDQWLTDQSADLAPGRPRRSWEVVRYRHTSDADLALELEALFQQVAPVRVIGMGHSRVVVEIPGRAVIKLGEDRSGANENEVVAWRHARHTQLGRRLLVPVLTYDYRFRWLVMPLVEVAWPSELGEIEQLMDQAGLSMIDLYNTNAGFHEGQVKLLDYALLRPLQISGEPR